MGDIDIGLLGDSTATHESMSVRFPEQYPPLPKMSAARQFVMMLNQTIPLQFQLWQHSDRGMEVRNRNEAKQTGIDPSVRYGRLRDVAQAQSSHEVTTGSENTGLAARRGHPEVVDVGTALPQGLVPGAQPAAQGPGKPKRRKRPHEISADDKIQKDFSRFTHIDMQLWSKFPEGADLDNDGFPFYTGHYHLPEGQFVPKNHVVSEPKEETTMGMKRPPKPPCKGKISDLPPSGRYEHNPHETEMGRDGIAEFVSRWPQGYVSTAQTAVLVGLTGPRSAGPVEAEAR